MDSVIEVFQKLYIRCASLAILTNPYFLRLLSTTNSSPYTGIIGMYLDAQSPSSSTSIAVHLIILICFLSVGRSSITTKPRINRSASLGKSLRNTLEPSLSKHNLSALRSVYQYSAILISSFITHSALVSPVPFWVNPTPVSASGYIFSNIFLLTT